MSYELCSKVKTLEPYEPISGSYSIRLDANESFYNMPENIKDEIKTIIDDLDFNRYPDPKAHDLAVSFSRYYGIDPENVTVTNGSDEMLYLLSSAMLQRGSRVCVTEPDFSMYDFYSYLSENEILVYKKDDNLDINTDDLISFVNENKADMLIFSNPCNPTGRGISYDDAIKLVENTDCLVVLDEAYMDFWDQSVIYMASRYENLIVLKTASKAVGAAAVRLGFAVANEKITKALQSVKSPYNVNTLSQRIGECIYNNQDVIRQRRDTIVKNTKELYKGLTELQKSYSLPMKIYEPHTNFVFIEWDKAENVFDYLLKNSIAIRCFKKLSALRITAGSSEENEKMLSTFEKYIIEKFLTLNK